MNRCNLHFRDRAEEREEGKSRRPGGLGLEITDDLD